MILNKFSEKGVHIRYDAANDVFFPILHIEELHPGYEDHASDVWLVKTKDEEVIVRSSKLEKEPNNDFWWGCKQLFELTHNLFII